jgi:hypothetical protein
MRTPGERARAAASAVAAAASVYCGSARAELREAVERVADAWRAVGASVAVDRTRFLTDDNDDDHPVVIPIPDLPEGECTTLVLLGSRGLGFHVRLPPVDGDGSAGQRLMSVAGVLAIERCGEDGPRRLIVSSDSGRGALETIAARSSQALPGLRTVLPERLGGVLMTTPEPGALPPLPPPQRRAEIAETRARRDGAFIAARDTWAAGVDGNGSGEAILDPGCHTMELFAPDPRLSHPARRGKLDLDAEMRDESDDRVLARDHSDAPDAQLAACVGDTTRVIVVFAGSPPAARVLVAHFAWPLPDRLPTLWGPDTRARMAHVLLARHVASLPREAVMLAQGGSGDTPIPLSIEPGACYLAVTARIKESARTIGLRVHVGSTDAFDDRGIDGDGAAVAFCAGDRAFAIADVQARGTALLGWGFALYRLQSNVWEVAR